MTSIHDLPFDAHVKHAGLPKASFLRVSWCKGLRSRFLKTRGANYFCFWFGPLEVTWRRPWLAGPARQLHPELFNKESTQCEA